MIEEKVLKEIEDLKQAYWKKKKVYEAERKKLLELAEKYVAENDIRNDVKRLSEIIGILPYSRLRDRLYNYLYNLSFEEKQQPVQEEEQGTAATESGRKIDQANSQGNACRFEEVALEKIALKEIKCQNKIFQKKEKALREVEEKLEDYVMGYLNKNGIKNDIEKLDEVMDVLPAGILHFKLLECKYGLMKKAAHQQGVPEKDAEIQEGVDAPQESYGTQAKGMGGIQ